MIYLFFCRNYDCFHDSLVLYKMIVPWEGVYWSPEYRTLISAKKRVSGQTIGYFLTCDFCISKGVQPELTLVDVVESEPEE